MRRWGWTLATWHAGDSGALFMGRSRFRELERAGYFIARRVLSGDHVDLVLEDTDRHRTCGYGQMTCWCG